MTFWFAYSLRHNAIVIYTGSKPPGNSGMQITQRAAASQSHLPSRRNLVGGAVAGFRHATAAVGARIITELGTSRRLICSSDRRFRRWRGRGWRCRQTWRRQCGTPMPSAGPALAWPTLGTLGGYIRPPTLCPPMARLWSALPTPPATSRTTPPFAGPELAWPTSEPSARLRL